MRQSSLVLILAFTLSAAAAAQSEDSLRPDEPSLEFEGLIEVSEVLLDVLATDADGNFVPGLGRDDFIVEENGEPVRLTDVSYYTTRYGGTEAAGTDEVPSSRYFILFFHDQWRQSFRGGALRQQQIQAGRESRRWLREEKGPSDWVAVVSYGLSLKLYQDFTQDPDVLARAARMAAAGHGPSKPPFWRREKRIKELSVLSSMPRGPELRRKTKNVHEALGLVAEACAHLAGRKNLLMFTIGFGKPKNFGQAEPDPQYYPQLETTLNDHNIAVYPIDLAPSDRDPVQTDFLYQLAADTGGSYHAWTYNFLDPLRSIGGDAYAYYVLSYQSEHPAGEIGYQRVEVKARGEGIYVRARTGYRYGL